jgi:hypothetical protein
MNLQIEPRTFFSIISSNMVDVTIALSKVWGTHRSPNFLSFFWMHLDIDHELFINNEQVADSPNGLHLNKVHLTHIFPPEGTWHPSCA